MDIDIFQNVDDYMNASHDDDMPPPPPSNYTLDMSDTGTPEVAASKRGHKRTNAASKAASSLPKGQLQLDDDDDDDDEDCASDTSGNFMPGRGQKMAVARFAKIKGNLEKIVQVGNRMQAQHLMDTQHTTRVEQFLQRATAPTSTIDVIDLSDDEDSTGKGAGSAGQRNRHNASTDDPFEEENYTVQVKVKWMSEPLERVPLRRYQPLSDLCAVVAERHGGIPAAEILLMLNERIVRHEETLDSIDYTIGKFLSARRMQTDVLRNITGASATSTASGGRGSSRRPAQPASATAIELKIQSSLWKRPLTVSMEPTKKMMVLVILCAQQLKCEPGRLRLRFDGEALDLNATAQQLELEGGEVMDLWMADE